MGLLRRQEGYTLIEVMAATAIFLLAVLAVSGLLMQGYRVMGSAGKRSMAIHSTQQDIENAINNTVEDTEEITREPYTIEIFGIQIEGTLITVKKTYSGQHGGVVTYITFVPGTVEGGD